MEIQDVTNSSTTSADPIQLDRLAKMLAEKVQMALQQSTSGNAGFQQGEEQLALEALDKNGDGQVAIDELVSLVDKDGDGQISSEELNALLQILEGDAAGGEGTDAG